MDPPADERVLGCKKPGQKSPMVSNPRMDGNSHRREVCVAPERPREPNVEAEKMGERSPYEKKKERRGSPRSEAKSSGDGGTAEKIHESPTSNDDKGVG